MKITRDSIVWWIGIVAAVIVGLASLNPGSECPASLGCYGIPSGAAPYLRLIALVTGIVSGKMATSPLAGENDPEIKKARKAGDTIL